MEQGYLIDSNVVIDFLNGRLPLNARVFIGSLAPVISFITQIEIFASNKITEEERFKLEHFIQLAEIYKIDQSVIDHTINIRINNRCKLPDAIIAGTAMANKLTLITRNVDDFKDIAGITVINPYHI